MKKIRVSHINIPENFKSTPPRKEKMNRKRNYFTGHGVFESPIIVVKTGLFKYMLIDGYTSYLLAREFGIKKVKVNVLELNYKTNKVNK